ncbi:hypothetical protein CC79DRAFT_525145 [Sarocladium strictum]
MQLFSRTRSVNQPTSRKRMTLSLKGSNDMPAMIFSGLEGQSHHPHVHNSVTAIPERITKYYHRGWKHHDASWTLLFASTWSGIMSFFTGWGYMRQYLPDQSQIAGIAQLGVALD